MKKYIKPSLQGLGLLRVVTTQLSDPPSSVGSDTGSGSDNSHKQWYEHGHGLPGELI